MFRVVGIGLACLGLGILVGIYIGVRLAEDHIREQLERAKRYQTRGTL